MNGNNFSVNIEGVERGCIKYPDLSYVQNVEIIHKLFGFSRVRLDNMPARKSSESDPRYSKHYTNYQTSGIFDYSLIKDGKCTIESLSEDTEVRALLQKGYDEYLNKPKNTTTTQTAQTQGNVELGAILELAHKAAMVIVNSNPTTKEEKVANNNAKLALIKDVRTHLFANDVGKEFNIQVKNNITKIEAMEWKDKNILKTLLGKVGLASGNGFIDPLIWDIVCAKKEDRNTINEARFKEFNSTIDALVNEAIQKDSVVIPQETTIEQPPVQTPEVEQPPVQTPEVEQPTEGQVEEVLIPETTPQIEETVISPPPIQEETIPYTPNNFTNPVGFVNNLVVYGSMFKSVYNQQQQDLIRQSVDAATEMSLKEIYSNQTAPEFGFYSVKEDGSFQLRSTKPGFKTLVMTFGPGAVFKGIAIKK